MAVEPDELELTKGSMRKVTITVRDKDKNPININTFYDDICFAVSKRLCPDAPIFEIDTGDDVTILTQSGATLGQAEIVIKASRTENMDPGDYVFDIWLVPTVIDDRVAALSGKLFRLLGAVKTSFS